MDLTLLVPLAQTLHITCSWGSHSLIVASRTYKANGETFLLRNDVTLDFQCPSSSPEMTVRLSQLFITTEGLSLFLLEKHRQVSRQVPGDLRREGL